MNGSLTGLLVETAPNDDFYSAITSLPSQATLKISEHPFGAEPMAALGIDPIAMEATPSGECARIDVDADDGVAFDLPVLLRLFGDLHEKFPRFRRLVAVFEHRSEGLVIFLPTPWNANR